MIYILVGTFGWTSCAESFIGAFNPPPLLRQSPGALSVKVKKEGSYSSPLSH